MTRFQANTLEKTQKEYLLSLITEEELLDRRREDGARQRADREQRHDEAHADDDPPAAKHDLDPARHDRARIGEAPHPVNRAAGPARPSVRRPTSRLNGPTRSSRGGARW